MGISPMAIMTTTKVGFLLLLNYFRNINKIKFQDMDTNLTAIMMITKVVLSRDMLKNILNVFLKDIDINPMAIMMIINFVLLFVA